VQNEFLRLWQKDRDRSVLFVTHDLGEAIALADRIVLIGNGEVLEDIEVGIDRPRDLELITADRRYVELVELLRDRLR
jgi:NitT/TauT family transport system ATP-binding protein